MDEATKEDPEDHKNDSAVYSQGHGTKLSYKAYTERIKREEEEDRSGFDENGRYHGPRLRTPKISNQDELKKIIKILIAVEKLEILDKGWLLQSPEEKLDSKIYMLSHALSLITEEADRNDNK